MINSKKELKRYLKADKIANGMSNPLFQAITYNDNFAPHKLLRLLRHTEYYGNKYDSDGGIITKLVYFIYLFRLRRWRIKTGIMIFPNCFGPGLKIVHPGFRRLDSFVKCGRNCTILPNVLLGKKSPDSTCFDIKIGDDCYISTGVTILGPVKIGNNVTIGAGAVVTKDIPDNAVVGGVPAKIIKFKL